MATTTRAWVWKGGRKGVAEGGEKEKREQSLEASGDGVTRKM
jgi:hypothetical protein